MVFKLPMKRLIVLLISMVFCSYLNAADEYYLFDATWNRPFPQEIKSLANKHASASGLQNISASHGYLVDEAGKRVKLWGAAIRLTNELLASPGADKKQLILTMKNLGFNEIRFNGLDFTDPGIYTKWQKTGEFDQKKMAGLCELIEHARDNGMAYTLSVNHITTKFSLDKSLTLNKHHDGNKRLKQVQFYDDAIIKQTKKWFSALLSEKHNGCRFAFNNDPSFYYLNIVNEDSIFQGYAENFRHLSKENIKALEHRFYEYVVYRFNTLNAAFNKWISQKSHSLRSFISIGNKQLRLCYKKEDWLKSTEWCNTTIEFLMHIEENYFTSIKQEIKKAGYAGVITTTNIWYGYFNLINNDTIGDAINTHIYFDPIKRKKIMGKKYEAISNFSFIESPYKYEGFSKNQIFRLFTSAVVGKPIIISEWNHLMWSDYAYEGPILLMATSLLQDVQSISLHTFVSKNSYTNKISKSGLSVLGNPVLYALLPSLGSAFLNTEIEKDRPFLEFEENVSLKNWETLFSGGMRPQHLNDDVPIEQGFKNKIRKTLGNKSTRQFEKEVIIQKDERKIHSVPTIINWDQTQSGNEHLVVKSEPFLALVGVASDYIDLGDGIAIKPTNKGAITLCALDGNRLKDSKKILITTVSKSKNTDQNFINVGFGKKTFKVILSKGKGPQYLKKNPFDMVVSNSAKGRATVRPLLADSNSVLTVPSVAGTENARFNLGRHDTPWYVLEYMAH